VTPLTPVLPPRLSTGSEGWRLYEYITRHFIATVSEDCKYLQTTIDFTIGKEAFSCSGKTLISPGGDLHLLQLGSTHQEFTGVSLCSQASRW